MYCPKCGTLNPDNASACVYCAEPFVPAQPPVQQPPQPVPAPSEQGYAYAPAPAQQVPQGAPAPVFDPDSRPGRLIAAVRNLFSSRLFLIMTVALTVSAVIGFIASFFTVFAVAPVVSEVWKKIMELSGGETPFNFSLNVSLPVGSVITLVLLWTLYGSAKRGKLQGRRPWQLVVFRVFAIIEAAAYGFLTLCCLFMAAIAGAVGPQITEAMNEELSDHVSEINEYLSSYGLSFDNVIGLTTTVLIIVFIGLAVVCLLQLVYQIFKAGAMRRGCDAAQGIETKPTGFLFLAIMEILFGVGAAGSALTSVGSLLFIHQLPELLQQFEINVPFELSGVYSVGVILSALAQIATAVYSITKAMLYLRARKDLKEAQALPQ